MTTRQIIIDVPETVLFVELALARYGAPVYVRHEIVHNRHVVDSLRARGAIFVEELDEIPATDAPVIFSAHGVPKAVLEAARARKLCYIDATCPLVSKVHVEAARVPCGRAGSGSFRAVRAEVPPESHHLARGGTATLAPCESAPTSSDAGWRGGTVRSASCAW